MKDFSIVEKKAQAFADAREDLMDVISKMKSEMKEISVKYGKDVRKAVRKTADCLSKLKTEIDSNRDLFDKPKTQVFSGIKCGLQKKVGKIVVEDPEQTIALIKKSLPKYKDILIKTTESVVVSSMKVLQADELKKIGAQVTADVNNIFVKPVDGSVEKITQAVLKSLDIDTKEDTETQQPA